MLWTTFIWMVTVCTLVTSVYLAFDGIGGTQEKGPRQFTSLHAIFVVGCVIGWLLFVPGLVGEFARGTRSAIPWTAFQDSSLRFGFTDGLLVLAEVIIVDLWIFWIPANLWVNYGKQRDTARPTTMVRVINVLAGLIIATPGNPIYKLLGYMTGLSP